MRTIGVKLTADTTGYISGLARAGAATKDFTSQMNQAAKAGKLDHVADQAAKFGLVGVAAFGLVAKSAADFDKQMSAVTAATHASSGEIGQLRQAALQAGKDTQYSATEAAKGVTELAKAGVSTANILGGGLKGALSLAAAGQIDVGDAAQTAASAMTQFKLKGDQIPHVADLLAAGAGKAQGSVGDLSAALNQAGLIASQTGLTIEDTTGTLAAFASAGLLGSDAGTSFKTMLQALQNPSEKSKALMDDLGLSAYDAQGNFIGIAAVAGQLKEKLSTLTPELRANALAQIFGSDATRAASVLYEQGQAGIQGWIDKTNDAGYAAKTAADLTNNLSGDIERLKGSLETLAISSGSGANSGLRVLAQSVNGVVNQFLGMPSAVGATVTILAGLGGAAALGLAAFIKVRKGLADAVEQLNAMGPAGEKAATGLGKVASVAGKATAVLAGLEVLGIVADRFGAAAVNVDALTNSLTNFANTGKTAGELSDLFGKDMKNFAEAAQAADAASHGFWGGLNDLTSSIPGVGQAVDALNEHIYGMSFNQAKDSMVGLDAALVNFMTTTNDAKKSSDLWNQMLLKSGLNTEQLAALLPDAYKKVGELNTAADKGAGALGALGGAAAGTKGQVAAVGKSAEQTAADLKALTDAVDKAISGHLSLDRAEIAARDGMTALKKELDSGVHSLSLNSAEGRKNRGAVLDQIDAINDLRKSRINEGMTLDAADGKYKKDIDGLRNSMLQAGFSKKAVDALIGSYKKIPDDVTTKIGITGDKAVGQKLDRLRELQESLKAGKNISVANKMGKVGFGYSGGGWTGPGSEHDEAGVVHADEFVIQKSSRRKIEQRNPGLLDEMNATGQVPGYAGGGHVAWPFPVTAAMTRVPSKAEALQAVTPSFGAWPSSPSAQRGDSGVWRSIVALIKSTGPMSGSFGNAYRPGDPKWHGSGRAVDWMGFNQDGLATFLAGKRPLELIHRTNTRDYAYTRGVNKGSFNNSLMQAHRNHVHIAMANGGVIREPVLGMGASGASYSFGEGYRPETVTPGVGGGNTYQITINPTPLAHPRDIGRAVIGAVQAYEEGNGRDWRIGRNAT